MKLSAIFGKYLYQHKTLSLPGIGVFTLDPNVPIPETTDKNFSDIYQHIRYVQQPVLRPDETLIDFIRAETGKIRPLAESDLESYLSDGKILLNIGKPFYFEGIGTLQKTRQGSYEFIPGLPLVDRLEVPHEEISSEDALQRFDSPSYRQQSNNLPKQLLIAVAVLVGLAAVIYGGYIVYSSNNQATPNDSNGVDSANIFQQDTSQQRPIIPDTTRLFSDSANQYSPNTSGQEPNALAQQQGAYRFVIEQTDNKVRAVRRYQQIKNNMQDIQLETNADSSFFALYFQLPASPADTARIKDSLRKYYGVSRVIVK